MRSAGASVQGEPMASPGLLSQHYAPRTPLRLYEADGAGSREMLLEGIRGELAEGRRVGVLATDEDAAATRGLPVTVASLGPERDVERIGSRLYAALRELDAAGLDLIVARDFPYDGGLWDAIRDRLRRAASNVEPGSTPRQTAREESK